MNIIITFILHFLIFATVHSFMAADYIKNKAEKIFRSGFQFYRLIYTIVSILVFVPVLLLWLEYTAITPLVYSGHQWLHPVFFLIRILAIILLVYAILQTDILEFIGIKQIHKKTNFMLITNGAYGITRHPLYTSVIILLLTKATMSLLDLTLVILVSIYFMVGAYIEEKRLLLVFGEEYRHYQQHVSMFLPVKWFRNII